MDIKKTAYITVALAIIGIGIGFTINSLFVKTINQKSYTKYTRTVVPKNPLRDTFTDGIISYTEGFDEYTKYSDPFGGSETYQTYSDSF